MRAWFRKYLHPILLTAATVAIAAKPEIVGTSSYGVVGWLTVAGVASGALLTYWVPNLEGSGRVAVKDVAAILTVGISAAINVAPDGISRADLWTIGAAVVAVAAPLLLGSAATPAVQASGVGQSGDAYPDPMTETEPPVLAVTPPPGTGPGEAAPAADDPSPTPEVAP